MNRFVCIHGHFYQPPRENPWLEEIELQNSAYPYHDWNERITDECYGPNATSRILGSDGKIERIVNNYARISFNFGPTLLSWMEIARPHVYRAILLADRESQERFSGHGSAIAQVYNHMILPLASPADMHTQVFWGIRDFERRFKRAPEGMWLSETAANTQTLEVLAEQSIKFTVLSPYQARRYRPLGARGWRDATGGRIDPRVPYRHLLPSGRTIDIFFYDGPVSQGVAFEHLLTRGEDFARRLLGAFDDENDGHQLVHIATDGETYGHHHRHGDMALAYALKYIDEKEGVSLTNYGEFLERFPPENEVQILEDTSWSCAHGVERWRSDCGCHTGANPNWNQKWRKPLKESLDWLRDRLAPLYEAEAAKLLLDPWRARDDYIDVILDRSAESREHFFSRHSKKLLSSDEAIHVAKLLEMQRHAMLMFTSCGWFFDDLSGIETVQVLQYAGRAIQLAQELFGDSIEEDFIARIEKARSNLPQYENGRIIYERLVRPAFVDLQRVGAHYAISSLFEETHYDDRIHCYRVEQQDLKEYTAGRTKIVIGRARFLSEITLEDVTLVFGALHFGHHTVNAGVRTFQSEEEYRKLLQEAAAIFEIADYPKIIRAFDRHFGDASYSLFSVFSDQQRQVIDRILRSTLTDIEAQFRHVHEDQVPLLRFLHELDVRIPMPLQMTAELVVNAVLRSELQEAVLNRERIQQILEEAAELEVKLWSDELSLAFQNVFEEQARDFFRNASWFDALSALHEGAEIYHLLPFEVNSRKVQNIVYELMLTTYREMQSRAAAGDEHATAWSEKFRSLADLLNLRIRQT